MDAKAKLQYPHPIINWMQKLCIQLWFAEKMKKCCDSFYFSTKFRQVAQGDLSFLSKFWIFSLSFNEFSKYFVNFAPKCDFFMYKLYFHPFRYLAFQSIFVLICLAFCSDFYQIWPNNEFFPWVILSLFFGEDEKSK